jgi:hypothetical protein
MCTHLKENKEQEAERKETNKRLKSKVIAMCVNTPTGCGLVIPPRIEG